MAWNGWHAAAAARGDGLRPELLEGLERIARRAANVVDLDDYRRSGPGSSATGQDGALPCTIIRFPVLEKRCGTAAPKPKESGLRPRLGRAKNLSREGRGRTTP